MSNVGKKNKERCQKINALKRFKERFGIYLDDNDYKILVYTIQHGYAKFLGKQSNRLSVFSINYKGISSIVIYDKYRKTIVTFLPENATV